MIIDFYRFFKNIINVFKIFLLKINKLKFVLFFTALTFLAPFITIVINLVLKYLFRIDLPEIINPFNGNNFLIKFFFVCILAPVLETYVFQYFFYELFLFKKKHWPALIFSSALFGLSHFYNPMYVVNTFFIGLVLGLSYIIAKKRKTNPILLTIIIHGLHNFIIIVVEVLVKYAV
ncbi:MAG: CPBP family intramembrane metalloprotease [Sphingobacteriales bacterium]|nr:MAG: CPBP family intramembrane metalloprotease [Sphingobacteriales bacterium]